MKKHPSIKVQSGFGLVVKKKKNEVYNQQQPIEQLNFNIGQHK